jgi:putative aldouronate transport system permease protein
MVSRKSASRIGQTGQDLLFDIINLAFLGSFFIIVAYPLVYILSASFSSPFAVQSGAVWLFPVQFSLEGYREVFKYPDIWLGYGNSLFYMIITTLVGVSVTLGAAFALSRKELPFRNLFMFMFTFTLLFSGGIIPLYIVVKNMIGVNNRWCMILPGALSVWNLIIARTFIITTIPEELYEAAKVDGCDTFHYFFRIVLPLSKSIMAVLTLLTALASWNAFLQGFIFLQSKELFPLQIILRNILISNEIADLGGNMQDYAKKEALRESLKYGLIVVASLPVIVLYPFVQKYFVKSIMIGAIKG